MAECSNCLKRNECKNLKDFEKLKENWGDGIRCSGYDPELIRTEDGTTFVRDRDRQGWQGHSPVALVPLSLEEVKTGQWVTKYNEYGYHKECSVCGARWMLDSVKHICVETPRCYNCGAKLEKEEPNDAT